MERIGWTAGELESWRGAIEDFGESKDRWTAEDCAEENRLAL
jgi:hypothetical protein